MEVMIEGLGSGSLRTETKRAKSINGSKGKASKFVELGEQEIRKSKKGRSLTSR